MYDLSQAYPKIEKPKTILKSIDKRQAYSALIKGFLRIPIDKVIAPSSLNESHKEMTCQQNELTNENNL